MENSPPPLAEQQSSASHSERPPAATTEACDTSIDVEATSTTNSSSSSSRGSSSMIGDSSNTVETALHEDRPQEEVEEGKTKKKTIPKAAKEKERNRTAEQAAPGSATWTPATVVESACGGATASRRIGNDTLGVPTTIISTSSHPLTNSTMVRIPITNNGRAEKYNDEKRPLHPPSSRLTVGVGVGAMVEGSEVQYYQESHTTAAVDVDLDDVEAGTVAQQPHGDQDQRSNSTNREPEQSPNSNSHQVQEQHPNSDSNSSEIQTGSGDPDNAPSSTTNGVVARPVNDTTEQEDNDENSSLHQQDEENPEQRADNEDDNGVEVPVDDSAEPPATTTTDINVDTNAAIIPPQAVENTSLGQQQQQQPQRQRQELPQAVPVPEPPSLIAGISVGSAATATGSNEETVVQAQPLENWTEEKDGAKCCRKGWLSSTQWSVGGLLFVVLVIVGVVIGVTQAKGGGGDEDNGPAPSPLVTDPPDVVESTMPPINETDVVGDEEGDEITIGVPSFPMFPPFSDRLNFVTVVAIEDPTTPQARANSWMMQDPYRDSYDDDRQLQRFSLATLYYSTAGDSWTRNDFWLDYELDECQWYNQVDEDIEGAICNEKFHMLKLNLSRNNLSGVLPVELFFFPALAWLDLSHNGLYGTAPTMFAGARYLQRLVLSSNQLTGQFTAELGFVASQLSILHNDDNQFTGAVPGLLRLLPQIKELNITRNQYTGTLPNTLMQLSNTLTVLEVGENSLSGVLPSILGLTTRLQILDVGRNELLEGTIPSEMSALVNLTSLNIEGTSVSGSLPGALCNLQNAGQLQVFADCEEQFQCCTAP